MGKKIRVWDGSAWQDVAPSLPYTAIHSAQASMPSTAVDGQIWLDTDGTLADTGFVPLTGGTMTGNLNASSINSGGISGKNYVINGNFDFWQRGTSFTTDSAATWIYTADRWAAQNLYSGNGAVNVVTQESTHVPAGSKYSIKSVVGTASATNTGRMNLLYTFENQDAIALAGKVITVSAQVKAIGGIDRYNIAGYYSTSGGKAHAGTSYIAGNASAINTSGFTKITATFTVPSAATITSTGTFGIIFVYYKNNAAAESVGDGAYLSQVKIEEGSQSTTFSTASPTLSQELAACQRYYFRATSAGNVYTVFGFGYADSTTTVLAGIPVPTYMRVWPTSTDFANLAFQDGSPGAIFTFSGISANGGSGASSMNNNITFQLTGLSGLTANRPGRLLSNNSTSGYIGFSAEL
jgi:hypothetical protein